MNILREKITFLTEKFIPASVECINCNCNCSGSVYSIDPNKKDFCMYLPEPTYSIFTYVILNDPYVNYNHFLFARILGIDIGLGPTFETMEEIKKYLLNCDIDNKYIQEYKKLVCEYDIAMSVPSEKIKSLKDKYNVEDSDLYIETIEKFDERFKFEELETIILS